MVLCPKCGSEIRRRDYRDQDMYVLVCRNIECDYYEVGFPE